MAIALHANAKIALAWKVFGNDVKLERNILEITWYLSGSI